MGCCFVLCSFNFANVTPSLLHKNEIKIILKLNRNLNLIFILHFAKIQISISSQMSEFYNQG